MKVINLLFLSMSIILALSNSQVHEQNHKLQKIGKVDQIFFVGQNKQTIFFISQQSRQYGYLNAQTGDVLKLVSFQNQKLLRISQNLKTIDFITQNSTLYTFDVKSKQTQIHDLKNLNSSLKQNINSFAKINEELFLLIKTDKVYKITSEGDIQNIQNVQAQFQEIIALIPMKDEKISQLYIVSFQKDQSKSQNNLYVSVYQNGQRIKKQKFLIVNKNVHKAYLNDKSLVIQGDKINYVFFGGISSSRRFEGKIAQYFNNQFIMDDYALYKPSGSSRHDFLVSEHTSDHQKGFRSEISIYRKGKYYEINYQFKHIRNLIRNEKNQIKRSWYQIYNQNSIITIIIQLNDNTLKSLVINNKNPYKRGQIIPQVWSIEGSNKGMQTIEEKVEQKNEEEDFDYEL